MSLIFLALFVITLGTLAGLLARFQDPTCVGAAFGFSGFVLVSALAYFAFKTLLARRCPAILSRPISKSSTFNGKWGLLLALSLALTGVLVFFFRGFEVLTGELYRGELRVQFGSWGFLRGMIFKSLQPALFAVACFAFSQSSTKTKKHKIMLLLIALSTLLSGLSAGSKTSAFMSLAPGLSILIWFGRSRLLLPMIAVGTLAFAFMGSLIFDQIQSWERGALYLVNRATFVQADPVCRLWTDHQQKNLNLRYGATWQAVLSSQVLERLHQQPRSSPSMTPYDYSKAVTLYVYGDKDDIHRGVYSTTTTVFGESLIALGRAWPLGALFVGASLALLQLLLARGLHHSNFVFVSSLLTWVFASYIPWINSGGLMYLLHPVPLLSLAATVFLARFFKAKTT